MKDKHSKLITNTTKLGDLSNTNGKKNHLSHVKSTFYLDFFFLFLLNKSHVHSYSFAVTLPLMYEKEKFKDGYIY